MKKLSPVVASFLALTLAFGVMPGTSASALELAEPDGIAVGSLPLDVAFSSNGKFAFVTNRYSNNVSVINTKSKAVVRSISVGAEPVAIERSRDNRVMYVTNTAGSTVSVINIRRFQVTDTLTVASGTSNCRLNPNGSLLACTTEQGPFQLNLYKTKDGSFVKSIALDDASYDVDFSKNGKTAYVVTPVTDLVYAVDIAAGTVSDGVAVGDSSSWPSLSPNKKKLYLANFGDDTVSVYSTTSNSVVTTISLPSGCQPSSSSSQSEGPYLFITCFGTGWVEVINMSTDTVDSSRRIMTVSGIDGIAVNPSNSQAYVTNPMTNEVWILKSLR